MIEGNGIGDVIVIDAPRGEVIILGHLLGKAEIGDADGKAGGLE